MRLASHGLDPTDPLTVATLTVTLVEPVVALKEIGFTELKFTGGGDDFSGHFRLTGENLDALKKDADGRFLVTVNDLSCETEAEDCPCELGEDGSLTGMTDKANFPGETCEVIGTVDPARTDVRQGTVTKTLVAV